MPAAVWNYSHLLLACGYNKDSYNLLSDYFLLRKRGAKEFWETLVKSIFSEKVRVSVAGSLSILAVLAMVLPAGFAQDATSEPVTVAIASPATQPGAAGQSADPAKTAAEGLKLALAGDYKAGLGEFKLAAKADPDNTSVQSAVKLLESYTDLMGKAQAQRTAEYNTAVEQVRRCMFAYEKMPQLAQAGLDKKLRTKILGESSAAATATSGPASKPASSPATAAATKPDNGSLIAAFNRSSNSELLLSASDAESAAKLKDNSSAAMKDAADDLKESLEIIKDNNSEFATAYRQVAAKLDKQFAAYSDAWKNIDTSTDAGRQEGARRLKNTEDDLADALIELESMVSEKPWLLALGQARVAVQMASLKDRDKVNQEDWYKQLVDTVSKLGQDYLDNGKWSDALGIFANLQELEPDNETYKNSSRIAQRHVRVMRLYGQKASSQPTEPDDAEPNWKELVSGVDVKMVRDAISKLEEKYVTPPDYRKLAKGALTAIKVLAQTPEAAIAFPGMADQTKQKQFVDAIDSMLDDMPNKQRIDDMELQLYLNSVVRESERTVKIPANVLSVEFTDGFLEELDKFSNMIWPYEVAEFSKSITGKFFGVGIQIGKEPGEPLKVVAPLEDSPAYKAGIKSGDLIISVDGQKTDVLTVDALVKRITGARGTKVALVVKRPGQPLMDITLVRDEIKIRTVKGWQRADGSDWDYMIDPVAKIGYIRISQFTEQTTKELQSAIADLKKQGVRSMILDLRFNPGGMLREAGTVADEFLDLAIAPDKTKGRIVFTRGRQSGEQEIDASPKGTFASGDLVVLVNQYSASAAEIVSGALKDWKRALVIGQRTYGKGSVQEVRDIGQRKAELKLTTAYYYLPLGRCLHRKNGDKEWGVDPDIDVLLTPRQTKRWLEIRRKTDLLQEFDPAQLKKDMADQLNADIQLNTAVMMLKLMQMQEDKLVAWEGHDTTIKSR
ncbi:MAG: PDZ domain-containing protein [Planctomycetaceae bacterium]|nr:MAG: PDZ domain-containing protein [Planctomycetaceae bacterium]